MVNIIVMLILLISPSFYSYYYYSSGQNLFWQNLRNYWMDHLEIWVCVREW